MPTVLSGTFQSLLLRPGCCKLLCAASAAHSLPRAGAGHAQPTNQPLLTLSQCCCHRLNQRGCRHQEGHQCFQQEDSRQARAARNQAASALPRPPQRKQQPAHPTNRSVELTFCFYDYRLHASTIWISLDRTTSTRHTCTKVSAISSCYCHLLCHRS